VVMLSSVGLPGTNGFVGEFLVLLGAFRAKWWWAAVAASGVILSACYMLWLYQRVFYGEVGEEVRHHMPDLSAREWAAVIPLILMMVWMGTYTQTFLPAVSKSTARVIEQTNVNVPFRVQHGSPTEMRAQVEAGHAR